MNLTVQYEAARMSRHYLLDPMNCSCASSSSDTLESIEGNRMTQGKAAVAAIVFFLTLGAELIPWVLIRFKRAVEYMGIGSCFAAGVILGAGSCHMAPHAQEAWLNYVEFNSQKTHSRFMQYPFPQFLAIATLLILIAIDSIVVRGGTMDGHSHSHGYPHSANQSTKTRTLLLLPNYGSIEVPSVEYHENENESSSVDLGTSKLTLDRGSQEQIAQAWVFFFALAIHSMFDGLSLGAQSHLEDFYALLFAILVHKVLDGFALGVSIFFANFSTFPMWMSLISCAMMTPLGIGIGFVATTRINGVRGQLVKALILSMTNGSFFFLSLIELLPSGLADGRHIKLKLLVTVLGFGVMALLAIWV